MDPMRGIRKLFEMHSPRRSPSPTRRLSSASRRRSSNPWEETKKVAYRAIQSEKSTLYRLSQSIWNNPELNYQEYHAHEVLTNYLEKRGFNVQKRYIIPTAFRAEVTSSGGEEGVTVCVMCEYDALPAIGHACGHNLIAEAGVAAGIGIKAAIEANQDIVGKLVVMGTPAEEGGGGKIRLMNSGALEDIDFAMMAHPTTIDAVYLGSQATAGVRVYYSSNLRVEEVDEKRIWRQTNAMDAAVACYNNISHYRQLMKPPWRIQCIFLKAGVDINVTPSETALLVNYRALRRSDIIQLQKPLADCFEGAAFSTGCSVQYTFNPYAGYQSLLLNEPLLKTYETFARDAGIRFPSHGYRGHVGGSTDMGNVSRMVPSIHPRFSIPSRGPNHTRAFANAAGSRNAQHATLVAGQCMALTALKIYTDPNLRKESRKAFNESDDEE